MEACTVLPINLEITVFYYSTSLRAGAHSASQEIARWDTVGTPGLNPASSGVFVINLGSAGPPGDGAHIQCRVNPDRKINVETP